MPDQAQARRTHQDRGETTRQDLIDVLLPEIWAPVRSCATYQVAGQSLAELAAEPAVLAAVAEAVDGANERLARVQQIKRWRLLPGEWTAESGELTPTFKLRRRVVHAKCADVIDALYAD